MIRFPQLRRLQVFGFPLYPGPNGDQIVDISFGDGPWFILGVNGLGKSTMLLMMRFLLAGPVRLRDAGFAGERADLMPVMNRFFAVRVRDDARGSQAVVTATFGDAQLSVYRDLSSLALLKAVVTRRDDSEEISSEEQYQSTLSKLMNLAQFEDAVRALDYVTFVPEMRMPLIWNVSAQFELFRALLTPNISGELRQREAEIISADSAARNLHAGISKMLSRRASEAKKIQNAEATRGQLAIATAGLEESTRAEAKLRDLLDELEEQRDDALLHVKRAERDVDDAARAYEKLKYDALKSAFAGIPPTDQYLYLKLLTDQVCLACDQQAIEAAATLKERLAHKKCPVCGNPKTFGIAEEIVPDDLPDAAEGAFLKLQEARNSLLELSETHTALRTDVFAKEKQLSTLRSQSQSYSAQIRSIRRKLPHSDVAAMEDEEKRLTALREQVEIFRRDRMEAEEKIESLILQLKEATERIRVELEDTFNAVAKPFFAERVRLIYAPRETRIGQQGKTFSFPAFEIEMTSGASQGQFVRRHIEQVSLSQREYLDIIFRMALIDVLGGGSGTLAIDGPEGSVDAVFAERAGNLFAKFGEQEDKNVLLASNIVEGGFIPNTLRQYASNPRDRVINLLDQAVPTAALAELKTEYLEKVDQIMRRSPT